jgi:hypothetical protein
MTIKNVGCCIAQYAAKRMGYKTLTLKTYFFLFIFTTLKKLFLVCRCCMGPSPEDAPADNNKDTIRSRGLGETVSVWQNAGLGLGQGRVRLGLARLGG